MAQLRSKDWQTLVSALADLHTDFDPQTLAARTLAAAAKIIAADSIAFTAFLHTGEYADLMWTDTDVYSPQDMEIFTAFIHENPLFDAYIVEKRTETLKITDLMPAQKFERTTIYNEFYRRVGVSNQLVTPMRISDELLVTCSMNIGNRDFSDRDKEVLTLFAPHLAAAIRNSLAYQRLSAALDTQNCGIVAMNSQGQPIFVSEFARRLFGKYFAGEKIAADALPPSLRDWIKTIDSTFQSGEFFAPPAPLRIAAAHGELTARLTFNRHTGERTLMLEEKRFASPEVFAPLGLTRREAEILFWITQGKSDEVIARLCGISLRTAHKHVQNIYQKLGVETRIAAMLRALEMSQ